MQSQLHDKLASLVPSKLDISNYSRMYLGTKQGNLDGTLRYCNYLIDLTLQGREPSKLCFLDYGGGTGMLSLAAKAAGFGKVIYNDIYDVSCRDARTIAQAVGLEADNYICSDIDTLMQHKVMADAIASQDVLEHIYDIEHFLRSLHMISHEGTVVAHASGANPFFHSSAREIQKKQVEAEWKDRKPESGHKQRDSLRAFRSIRRDIIKEHSDDLHPLEIELLVGATRGRAKSDIIRAIKHYKETGHQLLNLAATHATNTCDPLTGNWCERLINPYRLAEVLETSGFSAEVQPMPWLGGSDFIQHQVLSLMNRMAAWKGLYFSSQYLLLAYYDGKFIEDRHSRELYPQVKRDLTAEATWQGITLMRRGLRLLKPARRLIAYKRY